MVRRRWVMVLIIVLAMAVPAVGVSLLQTPQYQAVGQMLLTRQQLDENFNITPGVLTDTQVNNEVALLTSADVVPGHRASGRPATSSPWVAPARTWSRSPAKASDAEAGRRHRVGAYLKAYPTTGPTWCEQTLDGTAPSCRRTATDLQGRIDALDARAVAREHRGFDRALLQQQLSTVQSRLSGSRSSSS